MKAVILGASGQVGRALLASAPTGSLVTALTREDLDITDAVAVRHVLERERPDFVFNAAAYTAVDRAEIEPELAYRINRDGAGVAAEAAHQAGAKFVHLSTDFVFDGLAAIPYRPDTPTNPLSVYGNSKAAGETTVLAGAPKALIVRTAWIYATGGKNFVETMLRLMADGKPLRVVADQVGTPTHAATLAQALWAMAAADACGIHHFTDAGVASWYDFAVAVGELGHQVGLLETVPEISPITTAEFATAAHRPSYSVLDKTSAWEILGRCSAHWRHALAGMIASKKGAQLNG